MSSLPASITQNHTLSKKYNTEILDLKSHGQSISLSVKNGQLLQWNAGVKFNEAEILFMSDKAYFDKESKNNFCGGIPICWPAFGRNNVDGVTQHGFARFSDDWVLDDNTCSENSIGCKLENVVVFVRRDNGWIVGFSKNMGGQDKWRIEEDSDNKYAILKFEVFQRFTLSEDSQDNNSITLNHTFEAKVVENLSEIPFVRMTFGFHNYFASGFTENNTAAYVGAELRGVEHKPYVFDNDRNFEMFDKDSLVVDGKMEIDRIFFDVAKSAETDGVGSSSADKSDTIEKNWQKTSFVRNMMGTTSKSVENDSTTFMASVTVESTCPDLIVWNIGSGNEPGMKDMEDDGAKKYLCVEPAACRKDRAVRCDTFRASDLFEQRITVNQLDWKPVQVTNLLERRF